jgi:DNA polymerase III subunit delta
VPLLEYRQLVARIGARTLQPVHLFYGEDVKLVDQTVDAVEATVDEADRPFAVERLYVGESGGQPVDIAAAARVYPMLGDRRIVIVLRAERMLKPKRTTKAAEPAIDADEAAEDAESDAADLTPLDDYLAEPSPSSVLLFVATEIDRGRRFTKRLLERAQVTEFSAEAAPDWLQDALQRAGRTIEPAALQLLRRRAGGDITKLRGDVERLLLYTEGQTRIGADDVSTIASDENPVEDDWALVNAIGNGSAKEALREMAKRLDRGDSPHAVLGQLRWWVTARLVEREAGRVRAAVEALWRTDLALKSSGGDERVLMERLVVELSLRQAAREA